MKRKMCWEDYPVLADLGDDFILVAHPNGPAISSRKFNYLGTLALPCDEVPEKVRLKAIEALMDWCAKCSAWPKKESVNGDNIGVGKDQILQTKIVDGKLVMSIGVDVLAFAQNNNNQFDGFDVINAEGFAKDVLAELEREEEDGTTKVHELLDEAMEAAHANGSEHTKEREYAKT